MKPVKLYGVWLPKIGWLRGEGARVYTSLFWIVAFQAARRLKGRVYFVDDALGDEVIEKKLLNMEK